MVNKIHKKICPWQSSLLNGFPPNQGTRRNHRVDERYFIFPGIGSEHAQTVSPHDERVYQSPFLIHTDRCKNRCIRSRAVWLLKGSQQEFKTITRRYAVLVEQPNPVI